MKLAYRELSEVSGLVITDRDGTLIRDVPYLSRIEDIKFLPGVIESIRMLNDRKIPVCVATNQSGVARGYFSEEFVRQSHDHMNRLLKKEGAKIDLFLYCPHLRDGKISGYDRECDCRKPMPGLLSEAIRYFGISPENSMMVGDSLRDVDAARAAGVFGYYIGTQTLIDQENVVRVHTFSEAVAHYLSQIESHVAKRSSHVP